MKLFITNKRRFEQDYEPEISRKIHQQAFNELITAIHEAEAIPLYLYGHAFEFVSRRQDHGHAGEVYFYTFKGES